MLLRHAHATGLRAFLFSALAPLAAVSAAPNADAGTPFLSQEDARQVVLANILAGTPAESLSFSYLYQSSISDSFLVAGEQIISNDLEEEVNFTATSETYFIFIDDKPVDRWGHACRYVFVDAVSGAFIELGANGPPYISTIDDDRYVAVEDRIGSPDLFSGNPDIYAETGPIPPLQRWALETIARPSQTNYAAFAAGDTCGLIIRGPEGRRDSSRLDSATAADARKMEEFMRDRGVPSNAIKTITATGGTAMAESIKAAAQGKKKIWIYYSGHGWRGKNSTDGGPWVSTGTSSAERFPSWKALACSLEAAGADDACVVLDCCYAGRAVKAFQDKEINGYIATSSHPDSTSSFCYWLQSGTRNVTRAESKYTSALSACGKDTLADKDVPKNGVDLKEAHAWARKAASVQPQLPPIGGLLFDLTWLYAGQITIPDILIPPSSYQPFGLATDGQDIYANFVVNIPAVQETMFVLQIQPDLISPQVFPCFAPTPPTTGQTRDLAFAGPPQRFYFSLPFNQEFLEVEGCQVIQPWPFFTTPTGPIAGSLDDPLLWTLDPDSPFGGQQILLPYDIGAGFGNPPIPTQPIELLPFPLVGDPLFAPLDLAVPPLDPFPSTPRTGAMVLPIPPDPDLTGLHLYAQGIVLDPPASPPQQMLPVQILPMPEVQNPRGLTAVPTTVGGGNATLGTSGVPPDGYTVFVMDGDGGSGAYHIDVYVLGNVLDPAGTVGVPGPTPRTIAAGVQLAQSRPNPAMGPATISFSLPIDSKEANLAIYDLAGRRIRTLADGPLTAGEHTRSWDGLDDRGNRLDAGVYFYRLEVEQGGQTVSAARRLVRIR